MTKIKIKKLLVQIHQLSFNKDYFKVSKFSFSIQRKKMITITNWKIKFVVYNLIISGL